MNARTLTIVVLTILSTNYSVAQKNPNESIDEYNLRRYKSMKEGGIALTVIGGILVVTGGIVEASYYFDSAGDILAPEPEKEHKNIGTVLFCSGVVMVGGGIPLTIVGHRKHKYYKNKPDVISMGIRSNSLATGLSLTYRF